jgi:sugar/nucleoside kinase (ribokinase family)
VPRLAVIGNVACDRVDGGPPSPGGCPTFAALAFRLLGREGQILTRYSAGDRELFEAHLAGLGVPVTTLPAETTSGFALDYQGDSRTMRVAAIGDTWRPSELEALDPTVEWVHVAPLLRSDFPAATLAALAASGRSVSFDGQGLVRVPRVGEMAVDAEFDPALLPPLSVLKLAEDEAEIVAGGRFEARHAAQLGVPEILLTLGSEGAILYLAGGEEAIPVTGPVRDVQSTGAGDVFMVAYIAARSDGEEPDAAASLAAETVARMLEERKRSNR